MARSGIDVNLVVEASATDAAERASGACATLDLDAAWVTAAEARSGDPDAWDAGLAEICGDRRLVPVPVLVPPTGVPGAYDRARRVADTASARVVRLCPASHGYPLAGWVVSPLPELCERAGLAVLLDFAGERLPWADLVEFARSFPVLAVVVLGVVAGDDRVVPAALDAAPNLVCAVASVRAPDDLARLCETFGAHRFVFGSAEHGDTASGLASVGSAVDGDAREAVLRGNAEALVSGSYAERFLT